LAYTSAAAASGYTLQACYILACKSVTVNGVFSSGFEFSLSKFLLLHQFAMTLSKYWRIKAYRSTHLIIWGDDPSVLLKFPPMDADSEN